VNKRASPPSSGLILSGIDEAGRDGFALHLDHSGPLLLPVLALQLNVDFSDAGFLLGTSGLHFGDLVLQNLTAANTGFASLPALNGVTVRQFLADANTALGGGAPIHDLVTLDNLAAEINVFIRKRFAGRLRPNQPRAAGCKRRAGAV
jgi:hypothetical protein